MALSPKLDIRQSQSLVMTPQLMQSIKLLQMTHIELDQFLDMEIEKIRFWTGSRRKMMILRAASLHPARTTPLKALMTMTGSRRRGRALPKIFPPPSIIPWKTSFLMIWAPAKGNGNRLRARGRFPATATISIR